MKKAALMCVINGAKNHCYYLARIIEGFYFLRYMRACRIFLKKVISAVLRLGNVNANLIEQDRVDYFLKIMMHIYYMYLPMVSLVDVYLYIYVVTLTTKICIIKDFF